MSTTNQPNNPSKSEPTTTRPLIGETVKLERSYLRWTVVAHADAGFYAERREGSRRIVRLVPYDGDWKVP